MLRTKRNKWRHYHELRYVMSEEWVRIMHRRFNAAVARMREVYAKIEYNIL